ncbi:MAG TPA: hypothetical protein VMU87_06785, partial [Stellaceae bacterium]|nr:hypothetical protein [Stellaceae bacterium]
LGLGDDELALVVGLLAAGAHGWRAFECETLDTDGTYVGTVRLTTHPAAGRGRAAPMIVPVAGDDEPAPGAALRRARPKRTPAQRRVASALAGAASDPAWRNGDSEPLADPAPLGDSLDPSKE